MVSIYVDEELSRYNLNEKWNDYIAVQKEVLKTKRICLCVFENGYHD